MICSKKSLLILGLVNVFGYRFFFSETKVVKVTCYPLIASVAPNITNYTSTFGVSIVSYYAVFVDSDLRARLHETRSAVKPI